MKPDFEKEEIRWRGDEEVELVAEGSSGSEVDLSELRSGGVNPGPKELVLDAEVVSGGVIMPKLENATAK